MVNLWWNTVWLLDKTHLLVFNFWYRRLENIKTHISRHVLIRVRGPSHFDTWLTFILKTNKQKKNQQWCHTSAQCVWVCSVCVYFSVCVCESVCTRPRECVMVWSVLQQTLDKVVSYVCYWLRRRGGGGGKGRGGRTSGWGRGGRSEAAASLPSFTRLLHMMRRPWIEASRLWGGKHIKDRRELETSDLRKFISEHEECVFVPWSPIWSLLHRCLWCRTCDSPFCLPHR